MILCTHTHINVFIVYLTLLEHSTQFLVSHRIDSEGEKKNREFNYKKKRRKKNGRFTIYPGIFDAFFPPHTRVKEKRNHRGVHLPS